MEELYDLESDPVETEDLLRGPLPPAAEEALRTLSDVIDAKQWREPGGRSQERGIAWLLMPGASIWVAFWIVRRVRNSAS